MMVHLISAHIILEFFSVQTFVISQALLYVLIMFQTFLDFSEFSNECCKSDRYVKPYRVRGKLMLLHTKQTVNFLMTTSFHFRQLN